MRVGIIGLGMVGKEVLLNLYHFSAVREICVYDLNTVRVCAEIEDFEDTRAVPLGHYAKKLTMVNDYAGISNCNIVIINVSVKATGKVSDRIAALADNEALMAQIGPEVAKYSPDARIIITSNPVDAMTYFFLKYSHMNPRYVIGSGTILDSSRLTLFLAQHYHVAESNINAWVLGEHGKTSFIPWSLVTIAGMNLPTFQKVTGIAPIDKAAVLQKVIDRGLAIFNARGYTDHGIGACVFHLFNAIMQDTKTIMPVTCAFTGEYGIHDIHMSALTVIGANGVEQILEVPLSEDELASYHHSASFLKSAIEDVNNKNAQ